MKILHILNSVSYDGAAISAFRIAKMLPLFDHEMISLFNGSAVNEFKKNFVNYSFLLDRKPEGVTSKIKKLIALAMLLRKQNYDIIHFHGGGISVLFLLTIIKRKASLIFHLHSGNITGMPFKQNIPQTYRLLYRLLDPHITKIGSCEHVKKFYIQQIKPRNIESVHLIRNVTPYEFRVKNEIHFRLGYIGRIDSEKGIQLFFELCQSKELLSLNLKFVMMGDVSSELIPLVEQKRIQGIIEYIPPNPKVEDFYKMIDILIFPSSLTETLPLVILEAVSFDTAVIALKSKATEEIFGQYPMLVDRFDSTLFAHKVREYYSYSESKNKLRDQHERIANQFNKRKYYSEIKDLYDSLIKK